MIKTVLLIIFFLTTSISFAQFSEDRSSQSFLSNHNRNACIHPISNFRFKSELRKVKEQQSNADRLTAAKRIVINNCVTSTQVFELLNSLRLNAHKLEVGKLSYRNVQDPKNFDVVYDAFTSARAIEDLEDFIYRYSDDDYFEEDSRRYLNNNRHRGMNANAFKSVKQMIASESFDNTKLQMANSILATSLVTSQQVAELVTLFDFESNKLKFAKQAYTKTVDKENYFIVTNSFEFESSKTALMRFLKDNRN